MLLVKHHKARQIKTCIVILKAHTHKIIKYLYINNNQTSAFLEFAKVLDSYRSVFGE